MLHSTFTNRYEIKYLASLEQARALKESLSNVFSLDKNSSKNLGYYNYSIYLDSPNYLFYREKQEGILKRMKPRLRTHLKSLDDEPRKWFLELKGRHGRTVQKGRTEISEESTNMILNGSFHNNRYDLNSNQFEVLFNKHALLPVVSVLYFREPFNSELFPNVRITFDSRISGSLDFSTEKFSNRKSFLFPPSKILIELKYNDSIPKFVLNLFNKNNLQEITFSKFALCLESCFDKIPNSSRLNANFFRI